MATKRRRAKSVERLANAAAQGMKPPRRSAERHRSSAISALQIMRFKQRGRDPALCHLMLRSGIGLA